MRPVVLASGWAVAAFLVSSPPVHVRAHPGCFTPNETPTEDMDLTFCDIESEGTCCTPELEATFAIAKYNSETVSGECADYWKQVACASCSGYSVHLYEILGEELGLQDGLSMKRDFCESLVSACAGQIEFPTYDGEDYCDKHVGDEDFMWSYPLDESVTTFVAEGLVDAFPDLPESDLPDKLITMRMTPDGSEWWLGGQTGAVKSVTVDSADSATTVLDLSSDFNLLAAYEEGLLDLAFDPKFHENDYFYVSYTTSLNPDGEAGRFDSLGRFTYTGNAGTTKDSHILLLQGPDKGSTIHAGGWCGFKPSAYNNPGTFNELFWSLGDGGPQTDRRNRGQNSGNIHASIVRISVTSESGSDAVDLSPSGNIEGSVCAMGFRNPYRCGFDRANDDLYCGDVGHTKVEEIDIVECGNNYGWRFFEGSRCQSAVQSAIGQCDSDTISDARGEMTFPLFEYCHPNYYDDTDEEKVYTDDTDICGDRIITGSTVIGGYVYRGTRFGEVLEGSYIFAEAQLQNMYYLQKDENGDMVTGSIVSDESAYVISFAEDNDGELYIITLGRKPFMLPCGDLCATSCLQKADVQPEYESLGCYGDEQGDRALSLGTESCSSDESLMSPAICASHCATVEGADLFGLEFAYECWCGTSTDDYDKHGSRSEDECMAVCTGSPEETCGGTDSIEVYSFSPGPEPTPWPTPSPGTPTPPTPTPPTPTPPTPTPTPSEYTEIGCYKDDVEDRVLGLQQPDSDSQTAEECAGLCEGSDYFGTQFGEECFCSEDGDDPLRLGEASNCNSQCAGDATETCGGRLAMTVYQFSDSPSPTPPTPTPPTPTPPTPSPPTPATSYDSLGCYKDVKSDRALSGEVLTDIMMTTELCADFCDGETYFATQYGKECWCGQESDDPTEHGSTSCNYECAGDEDQTCGGYNAFNAYEYVSDSPNPAPAPAPAPAPSPTPTPDGDATWTYEGCYQDELDDESGNGRVMDASTALQSSTMTHEVCAEHCEGYAYFGVEYRNECFCSETSSYTAIGTATNCNQNCAGDSSQTCGGRFALSVFSFD